MPHVVIIGAFGSAGVAVAEGLLEAEVRLTLIDNGEPGGGLCILRGCMPSKEVLSAGAHRYHARHDHRLVGEPPAVDLEAVVDTKAEHVAGFAAHRRRAVYEMAARGGVEFIHDTARLVGPHTVVVGDREIRADYVVIATGSSVNVPELPGIEEVEYMTSADVLDATTFPDSGIVMGFGYVGLELVPYLAEAAGMDLTVVEHDARPLDEADPEFGDELLELYRGQFGVEILTETTERALEPTADGGVRLTAEKRGEAVVREADQLFLFTGRRPALDGLGLEHTALSPGAGWVEATMQARDDPRTFVVGDVNGHEPILHVAKEQGYRAAENILAHHAGRSLEPYEPLPHHVIFTGLGVYPYCRLGITEETARAEGREIVTASRYAETDGVFKTKDVPYGLAKLVVEAPSGRVLGYQGLHAHADSLAKTLQVVLELGLTVDEIPDRAFHPTLPEILDGLIQETRDAL